MKLRVFLSILGFVRGIAAATISQVQSKPFQLIVQSEYELVNGQKLYGCQLSVITHSLCVSLDSMDALHDLSTFYFSSPKDTTAAFAGSTPQGVVFFHYNIDSAETPTVPVTLHFTFDPSTNEAKPVFDASGEETAMIFDRSNALAVVNSVNDTEPPAKPKKPKILKEWYVCQTSYEGSPRHTLSWGTDITKPENPTCVAVNVVRKFVP